MENFKEFVASLPSVQEKDYMRMVTNLSKPGAEIAENLQATPNNAHLWHMGSALVDEGLELVLAVLAACRHLPIVCTMEHDKGTLEELSDCLFYLTGISLGISMEVSPEDFERMQQIKNGGAKYLDFIDVEKHKGILEERELIYSMGEKNGPLNTLLFAFHLVFDVIKKIAVYNKPGDYILLSMLCEDAWDILNKVAHVAGYTLDDAKKYNHHKLVGSENARYKTGAYSDEQANARADKA